MNQHKIMRILTILAYSFLGVLWTPFIAMSQNNFTIEQPIAIQGATIHIGNGEVIYDGLIVMTNGKFTYVGPLDGAKVQQTPQTINATGKHVYPGLMAMNTNLGLNEIGAVKATDDDSDVGRFNPGLKAISAYNTDSKVTETIRSNGVLLAQIMPKGGNVSGTSAIVATTGWNWEDATIKANDGIVLHWPNMYKSLGWWASPGGIEKVGEKYIEREEAVYDYFEMARSYANNPDIEKTNVNYEAMKPLFSNEMKCYIFASFAEEILAAMTFANHFKLDWVLVGAEQSHLLLDELKEANVPVILKNLHSLPKQDHDDPELIFRLPSKLYESSITFAISGNGNWNQRNLPFIAGSSVAYGLPYEQAVKSITLNPAKIAGIDELNGSIEVGKNATLVISNGDILDMRSSIIERAFINGREIDLNDKQKELYKKYTKKYGLE